MCLKVNLQFDFNIRFIIRWFIFYSISNVQILYFNPFFGQVVQYFGIIWNRVVYKESFEFSSAVAIEIAFEKNSLVKNKKEFFTNDHSWVKE